MKENREGKRHTWEDYQKQSDERWTRERRESMKGVLSEDMRSKGQYNDWLVRKVVREGQREGMTGYTEGRKQVLRCEDLRSDTR